MKKIYNISLIEKTLFLLLVGILFFTNSYSQTNNNNNSLVQRNPEFLNITTPNAASFTKFIDNPINLYNGTPDVSIPIYTLKDGTVELPIVLRYNTSGIRVKEEASWVGLGWNLNVGGVIVQNIVGDYDGSDISFSQLVPLLNIPSIYTNYYAPTNYSAWHEDFMSKAFINKGAGKLNPDVFSFSYPGGAGKFVVNYKTDSIFILGRTDATKIEIISYSNTPFAHIQEFKISTPDGTRHLFQYQSRMQSIYESRNNVSISFVLYKTIYPNGQTVDYQYNNYDTYEENYSQMLIAPYPLIESYQSPCVIGESEVKNSQDFVRGSDFYLDAIITTNYRIKFNTIARTDVYNGQALQSISIVATSQPNVKLKEFWFDYSYFQANSSSKGWQPTIATNSSPYSWQENYDYRRLKLLRIYEKNGTATNNKYEFEYDEENLLPAKSSFAVDYWGYYNGQTSNASYLPDLKRLLHAKIINNDAMFIDLISHLPALTPYSYSSYSNRGYDSIYCKAGILKKIIYPTKGYKEFTYEPNSFMYSTGLPAATDNIAIPNSNQNYIFSLEDYNQSSGGKSVAFTVQQSCTGSLVITLERGSNTWFDLETTIVKIKRNGTNFVTYDLTDQCHYNGNHDIQDSGIRIETMLSFLSGNYVMEINLSDKIPNQYGSNTNHGCLRASVILPPTANKSTVQTAQKEVKGCGLRIKKIVSNDLVKSETTEFEYKNPTTNKSSGILQDILSYFRVNNFYLRYIQCRLSPFDGGNCWDPYYSTYYDERNRQALEVPSSNFASNPYATIGGVGYNFVKVNQRWNDYTNGHTIYEFGNYEPSFATNSVRIDHPKNGKLLSVKTYDKNNLLTKTETNQYASTTVKKLFGLSYRFLYNLYTDLFGRHDSSIMFFPDPYYDQFGNRTGRTWDRPNEGGPTLFSVLAHQLDIVDYTLTSKETVEDGITTREEYSYNPGTLQLISKKILKSDNGYLESRYFYPNDYNFEPYTSMVRYYNILTPIIEEKVFNNNQYIGGKLTKYKTCFYNNHTSYIPDKKYFSETAPMTNFPVTFSVQGENTSVYPTANIIFDTYTSFAQPQTIIYNNAEKRIYLWSYNGQYPIAEIKNATYSQVTAIINEATLNAIAAKNEPSASDWNTINGLRTSLTNALVTIYKYKPLVGMTEVIDPRAVKTTYEYDAFGRLQTVKDHNGNPVENYDYHYKN